MVNKFNKCIINDDIILPFEEIREYIPSHNPKVKAINFTISNLSQWDKENLKEIDVDKRIYDLLYKKEIKSIKCLDLNNNIILETDEYLYLSDISTLYNTKHDSWTFRFIVQTDNDFIGN